ESIGDMTGKASGVTSIYPPQLCATCALLKSGKASLNFCIVDARNDDEGWVSRTRHCSKGVTWSRRKRLGIDNSSKNRLPNRSFTRPLFFIQAGRKCGSNRKLS